MMKNFSAAWKTSLVIVAILWIVFAFDFLLPADLRALGLRPRNVSRLWGILSTPFLHVNMNHLIANSCALLVLLPVSFYLSRKLAVKALLIIWTLGGGMVWLFASGGAVHIGASGIIFGLIGFLMFVGFFRKEALALICSVIVFVLYGGSLLTLLTYSPGISWSGHFFGFTSGILAAWMTKGSRV